MPILWRYLLGQYCRVLILCTVAFIAILLVMRLDDIAHFATLGASAWAITFFILCQIPYLLPIAIPLSSLISATLLIQRLSQTQELTALRASGFALRDILSPLLLAAAFLSIMNFFIVSELATNSHLASGMLKSELRALNPLLLARNKHLMELKGFYYETLGSTQVGESAKDVIFATPNRKTGRLNLIVAKELEASPLNFSGKNLTLISSLGRENDWIVENVGKISTLIGDFSSIMQKKIWTVNHDHLQLPLLLLRLENTKRVLASKSGEEMPDAEKKQLKKSIVRGYSEILRRLSIAIAVLTFTLMGFAFGIGTVRSRSRKGLYVVVGLAAVYLVSYFLAKGMDHVLPTAAALYLLPHVLIVVLSIWFLYRVSHGKTT
jgi:lipopolysaccharide export system permease protein